MSTTFVETRTMPARLFVWPRYPSAYEINTWIWLSELSRKSRKKITLSSVPPREWDAIATYGFDAVWLMGVWERSLAGIAIANENKNLLDDFRRALPEYPASFCATPVASVPCMGNQEVSRRTALERLHSVL